ncbi:MAG TPA: ATP-binding protein, partial [Myxococcaceae bacterium]
MALPLPRSLQAQFVLGLAALVLLSTGAGAVAVAALRRSADGTRRLARERLERLEAAQDLAWQTTLIRYGADQLVAAPDLATVRAAHLEVTGELDALDGLVERLGEASSSLSILDLHQSGQAVRNSLHVVAEIREQLLRDPGGAASAEQEANLQVFHRELQSQSAALLASAQAVSVESTREYRDAVQSLASASARDQRWVFGFLVGTFAAALVIARLFLGRRVLGRLQRVSNYLRRGDPDASGSPHLPVEGGDEIAEMARAVEQFLEERRRLAEADREAERRRAEEALRATEAELARAARIMTLGEMAASIAHEVNQPLTAILLNGKASLRWLSGASPDLSEARDGLKRMVDDATRAGEVIARVRSLTTNSAPQRGPLDLNEVIQEVMVLARAELQTSRVVLRTELGEDLPLVLADRIQLQQLVLNLLVNAADAMREVTTRPRDLLIQTREQDGGVVVAVRDSGVGLEPESRRRIFDAFYTTKSGGMGMGL